MAIEIRVLGPGDDAVLRKVAPDVFDHPIDPDLLAEFLHDSHHHLAVAIEEEVVVGFASGVTYIHPDKPLELWINEVGVAPGHRRQGVGKRILDAMFEIGRAAGCRQAWVLTEPTNAAARRLYESVGGAEAREGTVMYSFALNRVDLR